MRVPPSVLPLAAALLLAACEPATTPTAFAAPAGPRQSEEVCSVDDCPPPDYPCTDPSRCYDDGGTTTIEPDEPPGDPFPGYPGMWAGYNTTPQTCFRNHNYEIVDADADWLDDGCEYRLARAFAPQWLMHPAEECPHRQPYWAAKLVVAPQLIRVAYMPAYYRDCGAPNELQAWVSALADKNAHVGDSEFVMVEAAFNPTTSHWELVRVFLSAHDMSPNHRSEWAGYQEMFYGLRWRGYPKVFVARNKHANYKSEQACENGGLFGDICAGDGMSGRFPVFTYRNVGSISVDFFPNGTDLQGFISARKEYFYQRVGFSGWIGTTGTTPYYDFLVSNRYEYYSGPDQVPDPCYSCQGGEEPL